MQKQRKSTFEMMYKFAKAAKYVLDVLKSLFDMFS